MIKVLVPTAVLSSIPRKAVNGSQYDLLNDITERFFGEIGEQMAIADSGSRESVQEKVTMVLSYLGQHLVLSRLYPEQHGRSAFCGKAVFAAQDYRPSVGCRK